MSRNLKTRFFIFAGVFAVGLGSLPIQAKQHSDPHAPLLKGSYAFRMTPVKSFSADVPGDPAGVAGAPRQDVLRIGMLTADGAGNLSGHTLATTDTDLGQTWLVEFDWTGKYVVNGNGTGFFSVDNITNMVCTDMTVNHTGTSPHPTATGGTPVEGNTVCPTGTAAIEGHEDYAFVISTPGRTSFEFIETDNSGGGAKIFMTGTATRPDQSENSQGNNGQGH